MLQAIRKHMRSNAGDAHVSKMTIIAIVFVVGAILLVLTTSAFRNPVNNWFSKVTAGWFADDNGDFALKNQMYMYDKNENGTYKGVRYSLQVGSMLYVLAAPEGFTEGESQRIYVEQYDKQGNHIGTNFYTDLCVPTISEDGKTITLKGASTRVVYTAQLP